jgi:hypothetical protein
MSKKLYCIPVEWAVSGVMLVEAETIEEAIEQADNEPLPEASDYIAGSFEVNREMVSFYNKSKV